MKNTKENKEKFFAQYWGQEVLFDGIDPDYIEPVNSSRFSQLISLLDINLVVNFAWWR